MTDRPLATNVDEATVFGATRASYGIMPTIVPITLEKDWLCTLAKLSNRELPLVPTLVLAPHPDDETLGAGGLIAKLCRCNVPVTVVAITDGENAYDDALGLGDVRALEQTEACNRLGMTKSDIYRLRLPDRDVSSCEDQLVNLLLPLIRPGMHIVAPWPRDFHPDHEAAGRAAARAAEIKNVTVSYYLFWTWHRGTPEMLDRLQISVLPLTDVELETKLHALDAHASQFEHHDGQPILSPDLLMPAQRRFEVYIQ